MLFGVYENMNEQDERTYFRMRHIDLDLFRYYVNSIKNSTNIMQDLSLDTILDSILTPSVLAVKLAEKIRAVRVVLYLYTISKPYEEAYLNEIQRKTGVTAITLSQLLNKSMEKMGVVELHKGVEDSLKHQGRVWLELSPSLDDMFPLELIKAWDTNLKEMFLLYLPSYYISISTYLQLKKVKQLIQYADIDEEQVIHFLQRSNDVSWIDDDLLAKNYAELYKRGKLIKISITPKQPSEEQLQYLFKENEVLDLIQ